MLEVSENFEFMRYELYLNQYYNILSKMEH